jgi:hypothetical protein
MTVNAQSKLAARYGAPDVPLLKPWNDTIETTRPSQSSRIH